MATSTKKEQVSYSVNIRKIDNGYLVSATSSVLDSNLEKFFATKAEATTEAGNILTSATGELA